MSAWRPPRTSESSGASNRPSHANTQPSDKNYTRFSLLAHSFLVTRSTRFSSSSAVGQLICFWCLCAAIAARAHDDGFYAPQTFKQHVGGSLFQPLARPWKAPPEMDRVESYQKGMFTPARNDVDPQASQVWRPAPVHENWRGSPLAPSAPLQPIQEPWRAPYSISKEQQAAILHHKQALTSNGAFRFEYASDNGLAAGEQIEPDGSRVGAYQYKDPSGQLVKLKYRAGKDGFQFRWVVARAERWRAVRVLQQPPSCVALRGSEGLRMSSKHILEGSHLPKSPEPVAPPTPGTRVLEGRKYCDEGLPGSIHLLTRDRNDTKADLHQHPQTSLVRDVDEHVALASV
ncbi:hypothetical protein MSG28_014757 [Choristoneura fumiferana]|uniref:Uncharacterized protein n=1 Tax=Choristoneura fumiferana TaxID=7141 RepID=A0ACC0JSI8_CHOFU|nr:hypothetical protein MSG28_014757 [Choristoneura fumiferana]